LAGRGNASDGLGACGRQAVCSAFSGHCRARSPIMFSIRSRQVPHPVQAPVTLDTASTVAAPLSIAVLTRSLVTARQIHANTPSPLLTQAD
jgi:hypothetical protein